MFKDENFSSPIYHENKREWVDKLDKLCDSHIKTARSKHQVQDEVGAIYQSGNLYEDPEFIFFHDYLSGMVSEQAQRGTCSFKDFPN